MNVEEAILLLNRLAVCEDTEEQDNFTDQVNPVIDFNVSPNRNNQEIESCLNLSTIETGDLNNLFEEINQDSSSQSSDNDTDPDYTVEEESEISIETEDQSLLESNEPQEFPGQLTPTTTDKGQQNSTESVLRDIEGEPGEVINTTRSRKRVRCQENWKQNIREKNDKKVKNMKMPEEIV